MAEVNFQLKHGYPSGEERLKDIVLREPTTADLLESREQAERVVFVPKGDGSAGTVPELVVSPNKADAILLGRQIKRIGNLSGPFTPEMLGKLHREDFSLIIAKAEELDEAWPADDKAALEALTERGRPQSDQS